jgi:CHC2 zinc finger
MSIPAITRLKQSVSLQALAMEYLPLKQAGKDLKGLCPFHKEDTASFVVHEAYFMCFGCHATGDVITFYSLIEGVSAGRAIKALSERCGVSLEPDHRSRRQRVYERQEREFALWWHRRMLDRLALRLTAYVRYGTEEEAEAAGLLWRQMRDADPRVMAERCATAEERREYAGILSHRASWLVNAEKELSRCIQEQKLIQEMPMVKNGMAPSWLVTLGMNDWDMEMRLILAEACFV